MEEHVSKYQYIVFSSGSGYERMKNNMSICRDDGFLPSTV